MKVKKYTLEKLKRYYGRTVGIEAHTNSRTFGSPVAGKGGATTNAEIPEKKPNAEVTHEE